LLSSDLNGIKQKITVFNIVIILRGKNNQSDKEKTFLPLSNLIYKAFSKKNLQNPPASEKSQPFLSLKSYELKIAPFRDPK